MIKRLLITGTILLFAAGNLLGEVITSPVTEGRDRFIQKYGDLPVKDITLEGLRRTKKSLVMARLPVTRGEPLSSFNPDEAVQELRKLNVFHEIDFSYVPDREGVNIVTRLQEKWTLLPFPAIKFGGDYQSYGLFILETNFLGLKKMLYGGGSWSPSRGWVTQAGYFDPEIAGSPFTMSTKWIVGDQLFKNYTSSGTLIQEFQAFHILGEATFGYNVYKNHNLSALTIYRMGDTGSAKNPLNEPPSIHVQYVGAQYRYKKMRFKKVLNFGWDIMARYHYGIPLAGDVSGHSYASRQASYSDAPGI